jgi:hypothetical protein
MAGLPYLCLTAVVLQAAGCADGSAPVAPSSHPAHLFFANQPEQSGSHIFRELGEGFTVLVDDRSGLTLTAGLLASPVDLCADPDAVVASQDFLQFNATPSGALHLLAINKELHVVVYGIASDDFCALAEADVVAAGSGNRPVPLHEQRSPPDRASDELAWGPLRGARRAHRRRRCPPAGELPVPDPESRVSRRPHGDPAEPGGLAPAPGRGAVQEGASGPSLS